jgi:hypothetical protein
MASFSCLMRITSNSIASEIYSKNLFIQFSLLSLSRSNSKRHSFISGSMLSIVNGVSYQSLVIHPSGSLPSYYKSGKCPTIIHHFLQTRTRYFDILEVCTLESKSLYLGRVRVLIHEADGLKPTFSNRDQRILLEEPTVIDECAGFHKETRKVIPNRTPRSYTLFSPASIESSQRVNSRSLAQSDFPKGEQRYAVQKQLYAVRADASDDDELSYQKGIRTLLGTVTRIKSLNRSARREIWWRRWWRVWRRDQVLEKRKEERRMRGLDSLEDPVTRTPRSFSKQENIYTFGGRDVSRVKETESALLSAQYVSAGREGGSRGSRILASEDEQDRWRNFNWLKNNSRRLLYIITAWMLLSSI